MTDPKQPRRPRVFVSYHHANDQHWYYRFTSLFSDTYEIITDWSLDRVIDSDDCEYVERRIRENNIVGTSCTILLCGLETWKRKYVDWEIYATLYKQHALLGLVLPTANERLFPYRFDDNIKTGYAGWIGWTNDPIVLRLAVLEAIYRSVDRLRHIDNSRPKMKKNF